MTLKMIAVVVNRGGEVPIGGLEAAAECGGNALTIDVDGLRPDALSKALAPIVREHDVIVLPASPDGRDLAPRLAAVLDRPLMAGAVSVQPGSATVARHGGLTLETHTIDGPFVATLQPGVRGVPASLELPDATVLPGGSTSSDPDVIEVSAPDASELDLAEAKQILAVGAGLADRRLVDLAGQVADALGMSLGATRVITDWGWLPFERQIGTTGVMVDPDIYVSLAISGAVQHVSGLGEPTHVVSVNTDGGCPMSALADTNIVCDAPGLLMALADRLGIEVDPQLREAPSE